MTHLCHKPAAEGAEIPQRSILSGSPPQGLSRAILCIEFPAQEGQMNICLRRREFIAGQGGAAAWPVAGSAQQRAMPVVGWLSTRNSEADAYVL